MTTDHWNPELVAKLEAERLRRRPLPVIQPIHPDSREELDARLQMLHEIARKRRTS